ncbi:MAG TPA: FAD-dependent oxidoreductase [Clostridia bacterium]|nr:MAG: Gamma-glutamylputrescine oxidoreductase [Firmicutes bacterium ADurb.Bin248]HOF99919.1 FAD-dependent oxidoreductase [Clostridia bacterium]HOS18491.1 FAD-dependent oxidoreductase [Clostridia bacterium]HPK14416.1 FAD-dependent oxidoreductase [Clostridia bacterium]
MDKRIYLAEKPTSYWIASTPETGYPSLDQDLHADVAIVGGGIAGITTAYLLTLEGLRVAVIEADRILRGTTGHTTAKLTSQHALIYDKLIGRFGKDLALQYANANESAIRWVWKIAKEQNIDCDLSEQDAYVYTQKEENRDGIDREIEAALELGIKAEFAERIPFDIPVAGAVRFKNQAQFHPLKFLLPLAKEIENRGGRIFENSRAVELEEKEKPSVAVQNGAKVTADRVVVASHYPFINKEGLYFARIYVDRSYALGIRAKEKYPGGMYINAEDPSRSMRSQPDGDGELILVVGEKHKTGQGVDTMLHYENLMDFADEIFTVEDIPYRWSTQDCMTLDGVPYVGRYAKDNPDVYVATGYGKWGMTNAIASAHLIRDLIVKGESPYGEIYDPSRMATGAAIGNFVVQNANVVGQLLGGKLAPLPDDVELEKGEARVVEIDGHRAGAYRDRDGAVHVVDTTCTHLGCELNWNSAEKTWDCPCHGSRFTYEGEVVEGPANNPLNSVKNTNIVERVATDQF